MGYTRSGRTRDFTGKSRTAGRAAIEGHDGWTWGEGTRFETYIYDPDGVKVAVLRTLPVGFQVELVDGPTRHAYGPFANAASEAVALVGETADV